MSEKRREKEITRWRAAEAEVRSEWFENLKMVASGRNTLFFTIGDIGYGRPVSEPELLVTARQLVHEAERLSLPLQDSILPTIISAFAEANDRANEQRLGPIRLAQRLLAECLGR